MGECVGSVNLLSRVSLHSLPGPVPEFHRLVTLYYMVYVYSSKENNSGSTKAYQSRPVQMIDSFRTPTGSCLTVKARSPMVDVRNPRSFPAIVGELFRLGGFPF